MLRPATPLAILLFVAFAFHLLAVISTPIVKAIPLASFQDTDYGVFGFCQTKTGVCVGPKIGYTPDDSPDFALPTSVRHTLTAILIVHPVACFLTLVCFILAIALHWHSPAHSSRFLLGFVIFMLPTFLVSLLAFLIDVLVFIPHVAWGGWLVLASTILVLVCGVLTCVLRRTVVSRKERKERIAENAEMSGENFYSRQNTATVESPPPLSQEPTAPMVNGAPGANALPAFATFDQKRRISDDDRIPLNSRTGTGISSSSGVRPSTGDERPSMDRYGAGRSSMAPNKGRGGRVYNGPRDEYGNPLPPVATFGQAPGPRRNSAEQYPRRQYSNETMNSQGSRGRGRGGYPPRGGYGRGGPYGGRGGPGMAGSGRGGPPVAAMMAGAGAGMVAGETMGRGQQNPPPDYNGAYGPQQRRLSPGPYNQSYGGPPPGPGPYTRRPSPGPPSAPGAYGYGSRQASPSREMSYVRAESPPPLPIHNQRPDDIPIGQAIEMDATTGSPAATPGFPPVNNPLRESDSDVEGLVGLQQNRAAAPFLAAEPSSPSSAYSSQRIDSYVPARAGWPAGAARNGTPPLETIQGSPSAAVVAGRRPPPNLQEAPAHTPSRARVNSSDNYYEDVDPRFTDPIPPSSALGNNIPTVLVPGGNTEDSHDAYGGQSQRHQLQPTSSYDSVNDGPSSDASNFTSISQRSINPEWQAEHNPQGYGMGGIPNRGPPQQRDFLLAANPDFELPGGRGGRGYGRGGRGGGTAMPGMI